MCPLKQASALGLWVDGQNAKAPRII